MNNNIEKWFEVWFVPGSEDLPAYLVVVAPLDDGVAVIDIGKNQTLYQGATYSDVFNWLTEDKFELVSGRTLN